MMESTVRTLGMISAQRLSASQRWASEIRIDLSAMLDVLNAFRHHRGGHFKVVARVWPSEVCSTPFGITEVGI